jgi:predicted CopG family antitoxin
MTVITIKGETPFTMDVRHTISISDAVYLYLKDCGKKGETFDQIINRLLREKEA